MQFVSFFVSSIFTVTAAKRTLENSCPSGVLNTVDPFYLKVHNGSCFQFVKNKMRTYADSSADCGRHGGTLALPKTLSLNDYLTRQSTNHYGMLSPIWIGLHDQAIESEFVWQDNTKLEFRYFAAENGPSNNGFRGWAEDCVALDPIRGGLWYDHQCNTGLISYFTSSKPKKMYICQYTIDFVDDKGDQKNNGQQDKDQQNPLDKQDKD